MRYRVDGVPIRGAGAFMPGLVLNGVSFGAGTARNIFGFPGTVEVPIDATNRLAPESWDPKTQPSNIAPDGILPTVYIPSTKGIGPWAKRGAMRTRGVYANENPLPEPAGAPSGVPMPAIQRPAKIGGRRVVGWPRVTPRWPSSTSGAG